MSVKIRLTKTGRKHQVSFRLVAQDTRSPRDGKFLEVLGYFNPFNKPTLKVKKERVDYWMQKGAKPTEAVTKLLEKGDQKEEQKANKTA